MYDKKNPKYVGTKTDTYDLEYGEQDEDVEEELDPEEEMSSGYSLQLIHHLITTARGPSAQVAHGTPSLYSQR